MNSSFRRNKKGISSHILIIFIYTFITTFFLLFILDSYYKTEPISCQKIEFTVTKICENKLNEFTLSINNLGTNLLEVELNGKQKSSLTSKSNLDINLSSINAEVNIMPIISQLNGDINLCKSKKQIKSLVGLKKC